MVSVALAIIALTFFFEAILRAHAEYQISPIYPQTEPPIVPNKLPVVALSPSYAYNSLLALINAISGQKGVNADFVSFVVQNESQFNPTNVGDKDFVCNLPHSPLYGQISPSYGLAQINRCAHSDIAVEEANNPTFAISFIADQFLQGTENIFSAWRWRCRWYRNSPNCP